jgi:hypothetical protein
MGGVNSGRALQTIKKCLALSEKDGDSLKVLNRGAK